MLYIFDLGGVLIKNIYTLHEMAEKLGLENLDEYYTDFARYEKALMDGYMSVPDYYDHLERKYQVKVTEDLFVTCFHPYINKIMFRLVDGVRKSGHKAVIGSNTFAPHWDLFSDTEAWDIFPHFDSVYASHLMHLSKSDTAFWRTIMDNEGFTAKETVFIDDLKENTDGAASLGIDTFQYTDDALLTARFAPFFKG